ncbi:MAG TPA: pantoate--beta-alanine ligase [Gemmatimonadales bacterium]|nr:pantoate--beta-alanine ligase [Gemmatimonadales bacterium]
MSRLANMLEFTVIPEVRAWSRAQRAAGRRVGVVPTMGYLHDGHLALVDEARRCSDAVVLTIFVNPLQFGPNEDLARYPRDLPRDRSLAHSRQVDALFVPPVEAMYPPGSEVRVTPGPTADRWEGAARPGHFTGVLTVVAKLFHLIEPDIACFGRKDLQQLTLVRRMVRDLNWPIEIIGVPTVREPDGLALSSRNAYLDAAGRQRAVVLSRALQAAHQAYCRGQRRAADLEQLMRDQLSLEPQVQVEYIAITEPDQLEPVAEVDGRTVVALAARVGGTRLIDNISLAQGLG